MGKMVIRVSLFVICLFFQMPFFCLALEALPESPPIPKDNPMTPKKIELGRHLYFDPRLSSNNKISCASCHNPNTGGVDKKKVSTGILDKKGARNSPTVLNAAFMSVQFWDGRAPTLEEQAKGPIINPVEMGMESHDAVVKKISAIPGYRKLFSEVYGKDSPINIDNIVKAIAAYERTLITPNSPFDRYVKGEKKALTQAALRGMDLVQKIGCTVCHSGPNFAGPTLPIGTGFYQKFPVFSDKALEKKYAFTKDKGRFEVTKENSDLNMWRVPTWRNVAVSGPYFHTGNVKSLSEAVRVMAKLQLNRTLKNNEVNDIVEFLKSLTGKLPKQVAPKLLE